jgi:hypothetical protein
MQSEGKHWFVVYKSSVDLTEVFDSLGTTASFVSQKLRFKTVYEFNTTQVQSDESKLCGEFCLYFIVNRLLSLDMSFQDVLNDLFDINCDINEKRVKDFVEYFKQE